MQTPSSTPTPALVNCIKLYVTKLIRKVMTEKFKTLENVNLIIYITMLIFTVYVRSILKH